MRSPILLLLAIVLMPCAFATVDLLSPADTASLQTTTVAFGYYASVPGLTGCTLIVNDQQFPDTDIQNNGLNEVAIQNMTQGPYSWNIACAGTSNETSSSRTFTIDTTRPTITVVSPLNNSNVTQLAVDIIPNDETSSVLACTISWQGIVKSSANVTANTHYQTTIQAPSGAGTLSATCADAAGNTRTVERQVTLKPMLFLDLTLDKQTYGIGEPVRLAVDTVPGSNITIDVCPNEQGFVQCKQALLDTASFPQTITLPYLNKTGSYIVDGLVQNGGESIAKQVTYTVENTLTLIVQHAEPELYEPIDVSMSATGGIAPYAFTWHLSNGTVWTGISSGTLLYNTPGNRTERFVVVDSAGNTREQNVTFLIERVYNTTFYVVDDQTGLPIHLARITFDGNEEQTLPDGTAKFTVSEGTHDLFISHNDYDFIIDDVKVNSSSTFTYRMQRRADALAVQVSAEGAQVYLTILNAQSAACTLLTKTENAWRTENDTMLLATGKHAFPAAFPDGEHLVKAECKEAGQIAQSDELRFTVAPAEQPAEEIASADLSLQALLDEVTLALSSLESYGEKEQQAVVLLELDKRLRNAKRSLQQGARDLDALKFRDDLDSAGKEAERAKIIARAAQAAEDVPRGLSVIDDRVYVRYPSEEEIPGIAEELARIGVLSDAKRLAKHLLSDQQLFTISTRALHVEYAYADGHKDVVTVVSRSFTYAEGIEGYSVIELIPKDVIASAEKITFLTPTNVLEDDPILEYAMTETFTYVLPRRVDFTKLETVLTVLTRHYDDAQDSRITGFAIFTGTGIDVLGVPLWLILGLLLVAYLVYYFDLITHIKYAVYRLGDHEQIHYVRVMVGDVDDHLSTGDYEKAELLYREIRMTYDSLPEIERNDLYEDVMELVHKMDAHYFNVLLIELDGRLKAGDMEGAIASYEKLTGTYHRLDVSQQQELIDRVVGMGRRLGLEVPA